MSFAPRARKSESEAPSTARTLSKSPSKGLRLGESGNAYEREADRAADEILTNETPRVDWSLSRMSIMPSQRQHSYQVAPNYLLPIVREVLNSTGRPLDQDTRNFFEPRFGHNLDAVRVHHDQSAAEVTHQARARAYTLGDHVFFGAGRYVPDGDEGRRLLAHELAHVLQQRVIGVTPQRAELEGNPIGTTSTPGGETQKGYQFTADGQTVTLTEEQYKSQIARAAHNLALDFRRVEDTAQVYLEGQRDFLENVHGSHWYSVGTVSDVIGEAKLPDEAIWSRPNTAIKVGREAAANGNLALAARMLDVADSALKSSIHEWNSYMEKTIGGAAVTEHALETTRDVSFSIAIGTAAVVALPIVAAGASAAATGAGLAGTGATIAAGAGTLGTITAGGAVVGGGLRAASSAAGQKLAGDTVSGGEVWKEFKEGAKHGAVDASTAVVTAGVGKALGTSASLLGRGVRTATAGATGGAVGGGLGATLEGKSPKEVAKAAFQGAAGGGVGGALGTVGGHVLGESGVAKVVTGGIGGAGGAAASTLAVGGSLDKSTLITGAVAGGVAASAEHPPTKASNAEPPSAKARTPSSKGGAPSSKVRGPRAPYVEPQANKGPEVFGEISTELGLGKPRSDVTGGVRTAVASAKAAGFIRADAKPGTIDLAVQPHGSAPTVRNELGVTGAQAQSAHVGPTSALRDVPGYSRSAAETTLLPPDTHAAFDAHWKEWAMNMRRQGKTTCTAGELHKVMLDAIDQTPGMSQKTKGALAWRLHTELFKDLGLHPSTTIALPYPNIGP
jgi:Domain of unknown function (DUF4157)